MKLTDPPGRRSRAPEVGPSRHSINAIVPLPDTQPGTGMSLEAALCRRRSEYGAVPLRLEHVSMLLALCCRTQDAANGRRPYPSAGALYAVEVFVEGIEHLSGIFRYQAREHTLEELDVPAGVCDQLRTLAGQCLPSKPGTLIWLAGQEERIAAAYSDGESLLWREAGVLTGMLALVSPSLGLNAVPLGLTGEPVVSRMSWSPKLTGLGALSLSRPLA